MKFEIGKIWLEGIIDSMNMSLSKLWEIMKDRESWHDAAHGCHKKLGMTATARQGKEKQNGLRRTVNSNQVTDYLSMFLNHHCYFSACVYCKSRLAHSGLGKRVHPH